jgi:Cdc6-like AAA superfamily ATPase
MNNILSDKNLEEFKNFSGLALIKGKTGAGKTKIVSELLDYLKDSNKRFTLGIINSLQDSNIHKKYLTDTINTLDIFKRNCKNINEELLTPEEIALNFSSELVERLQVKNIKYLIIDDFYKLLFDLVAVYAEFSEEFCDNRTPVKTPYFLFATKFLEFLNMYGKEEGITFVITNMSRKKEYEEIIYLVDKYYTIEKNKETQSVEIKENRKCQKITF